VTLGGPIAHQAGALAENAGPSQIDAALRAAAAGLTVGDPALAFTGFARLDDPEAPLLTRRELDVLGALGDGLSNKALARRCMGRSKFRPRGGGKTGHRGGHWPRTCAIKIPYGTGA